MPADNQSEGKRPIDTFLMGVAFAIVFIATLIVAFWMVKNNKNLDGLAEFISLHLKLMTGIVAFVVFIYRLKPAKDLYINARLYSLYYLSLVTLVVGIDALWVVYDKDNSPCKTDPAITSRLSSAISECSPHFLDQVRDPGFFTDYEILISRAQICRKEVIGEVIDKSNIPPYCRACYVAELDSINNDDLATKIRSLDTLRRFTHEANRILSYKMLDSIKPWMDRQRIPMTTLILKRKGNDFVRFNDLEDGMTDMIQYEKEKRLKAIWHSDWDGNSHYNDTLEFIIL